jgi:CelD/BcsL family acetyltransferase involved in cellulose biosynthesis
MIRAEKAGVRLERALTIDWDEVRQLHERRWGAGNRSASFFQMLRMLMEDCGAQLFTARTGDGRLVGAQLDILGGRTRHYYYGISDKDAIPGVGTAVMGMSWSAFLAGNEVEYSFGRGAERYKYRYADAVRITFEIRGFLAPVDHINA